MKRGDVVKIKESAASAYAYRCASAINAAGVVIKVGRSTQVTDHCLVYWSDNTKSTHWETDLEMK